MTLRISAILIVVIAFAAIALDRSGSGDSIQPLMLAQEAAVLESASRQALPVDLAPVDSAAKRTLESDPSEHVAEPLTTGLTDEALKELERQLADSVRERNALRDELAAQARQIRELQDLIAIDSPELVSTNFAAWISAASPIDDIAPDDLLTVKEIAAEFPNIQFSVAEGRWIAERNRLDDWRDFAPSSQEAVLRFLGPQRVISSVDDEHAKWLRKTWADKGLFN